MFEHGAELPQVFAEFVEIVATYLFYVLLIPI